MSTVLEQPVVRPSTSPSQRLRTTMAAVRVSLSWFGTRKTLTLEQKSQAADTFGAEGAFLSAGKKLLDTTAREVQGRDRRQGPHHLALEEHELAVPGARHPADPPGPDRDVRRQDADAQAGTRRGRRATRPPLRAAEIRGPESARQPLQPGDYPVSLRGLFSVTHDFPSVEPPEYLAN